MRDSGINRRRFLLNSGAAAASVTLAGCGLFGPGKPSDPEEVVEVSGQNLNRSPFNVNLVYQIRNTSTYTYDPLWHIVDFLDADGNILYTSKKSTSLPGNARDTVRHFYGNDQPGDFHNVAEGKKGYQIDLATEKLSQAEPTTTES